MRYEPSEYCIECGERKSIEHRRLCKECYAPKNKEQKRRSVAKKERLKKEKKLQPKEKTEVLKGYLSYAYPKNYAGIRNL